MIARHLAKGGHDEGRQHGQQLRGTRVAKPAGLAETFRRLLPATTKNMFEDGATDTRIGLLAGRSTPQYRAEHIADSAAATGAATTAQHGTDQPADIDTGMIALQCRVQCAGALWRLGVAREPAINKGTLLNGIASRRGIDTELPGNRFDMRLIQLFINARGQVIHGTLLRSRRVKLPRSEGTARVCRQTFVKYRCADRPGMILRQGTSPPRSVQDRREMVGVDARFNELGERYRASLQIKRASIELAWHALVRHGRDPAKLENLRRIVHRIAGSAPSYGYAEIGQLASEADVRLERMRSGERASAQESGDVSDLAALLNELLDALAAASSSGHDAA